jgi:hypothetical protein
VVPVAAAEMLVRGNAIIVDGHTVVDDPRGVAMATRSRGGGFIAYAHLRF